VIAAFSALVHDSTEPADLHARRTELLALNFCPSQAKPGQILSSGGQQIGPHIV
jgi:hypothetical protein